MPRKPRSSAPAPARSRTRVRAALVLVVDDKVDNRDMYLEYLRYVGFKAHGAVNGDEAIALAKRLRPAVILMDLSLPGTDGWAATRILKDDPQTKNILIIAVTGHAEASCKERAMMEGCDLFLTKPCLPSDVVDHVIRLLDERLEGGATRERES